MPSCYSPGHEHRAPFNQLVVARLTRAANDSCFCIGRLGAPGGLRISGRRLKETSEAAITPEGILVQRISYQTKGGIRIEREILAQPYSPADTNLADRLDHQRGVLF